MSDDVMPELELRVLFADSGQGEVRTVPLNIGNRFTVLYELTEESQSLIFAGVPTEDGVSTYEILKEVVEYLGDIVDQAKEGLERD